MTTPATDTTTPDALTCPRCGSDDLTLDHAAHYTCGSCGGYTTTHDTALAVIERHRKEWQEEFERKDDSAGRSYYRGGVTALDEVAEELRQQPVSPSTKFTPEDNDGSRWDGDRDAFDPARADVDTGSRGGWTALLNRDVMASADDAGSPIDILRTEGGRLLHVISLPADLPHNVVISILRANGWTGGDDE